MAPDWTAALIGCAGSVVVAGVVAAVIVAVVHSDLWNPEHIN